MRMQNRNRFFSDIHRQYVDRRLKFRGKIFAKKGVHHDGSLQKTDGKPMTSSQRRMARACGILSTEQPSLLLVILLQGS